jgi:hypothetical protein
MDNDSKVVMRTLLGRRVGLDPLCTFLTHIIAAAWRGQPLEHSTVPHKSALIPDAYRPELDRLSRDELMDVAWHLARIIHDLADNAEGDMIELRCAIEFVQDRRRAKRRDATPTQLGGLGRALA